jgi:hypothetical protein
VSSWRDSVSEGAQEDLDQLLSMALDLAQDLLSKHGEFLPFAVTLSLEGEGTIVGGDAALLGEQPQSETVRESLQMDLVAGRDSIAAAALVVDVLLDGGDAVRVELEHHAGVALVVSAPYRREGGNVEYDQMIASAAEPAIWA